MNEQQNTGIGLILIILFILWWLSKNGLGFLHGTGDTTVVQSRIVGGESNTPTVTDYSSSGCCS